MKFTLVLLGCILSWLCHLSGHSLTITPDAGPVDPCRINTNLDASRTQNGSRAKLFILCHDAQSEKVARQFASCNERWMEPIRLNSSVFFETALYNIFSTRAETSEWSELDFVITATYKTVQRMKLHEGIFYEQTLEEVHRMLSIAREGKYDLVPFLRSTVNMKLSIKYWHGESFKLAWDALLLKMGYSLEAVQQSMEMKPFYRNVFISIPAVLTRLSHLMQQAMQLVRQDAELVALFEVDAKYAGGREKVALRVFGTKYYQLHPFVFERLPMFFLQQMGAKVCADDNGPCPYNY